MSKPNRGGYVAQSNRNIPSHQQSPPVNHVSSQAAVDNINGGMCFYVCLRVCSSNKVTSNIDCVDASTLEPLWLFIQRR